MIELKSGVMFDPQKQAFVTNGEVIKCCENKEPTEDFSIVPTNDIMSIVLFITNACNLRCPYCYEWQKKTQKIDMKYIDKAIKVFDKTLLGFSFFGGEPFLEFEYIKEIYTYIKQRKPEAFISINTNGTLLDDDKLNWVESCGASIVVSWDGYDDAKRYNGDKHISNEVLSNVIKAKRKGIPCSVRFTVTDIESESLKKSVDVLIQNKIKYVIEPAVNVVDNQISINTVKTITDFYSLSGEYIRNLPDYNKIYEQLTRGLFRYYGCGAGRRVVRMDTDGNIYDCHRQMPNKKNLLTNVMQLNDSKDIQNNRFFMCKVNHREECADCDYKYICGGGCYYSHSSEYCTIYKSKINAILNEIYNEHYRKNEEM